MVEPLAISSLILAGGQGSRMGGVDKGWVIFENRALVLHVIDRLRAQVSEQILISANRSLAQYQALGYPVLQDETTTFEGPLAGIVQGLQACTTPWLLCCACDTPFLPLDLAARLSHAIQAHGADIAYVRTHESATQWRDQPLCCLISRRLAPDLAQYLQSGQRKVLTWMQTHACVTVEYGIEEAPLFLNVNTSSA